MKSLRMLVVAVVVLAFTGYLALCVLEGIAYYQQTPPASEHYLARSPRETGAVNVVTAVLFDYRAFDTLGETVVIFAAVGAIALLFSARNMPSSDEGLSPIVKHAMVLYTPFIVLISYYIIISGHISPGGGFQGGVMLGALVLIHLIAFGTTRAIPLFNPERLRTLEALSAGAFLLIGVIPVLGGSSFLTNVKSIFFAGKPGTLFSGGSIAFLNMATGLKVAAGVGIIIYSMIRIPGEGESQ